MKASFYILSTNTEAERLLFCCRLIEKVLKVHKHIIILCDNDDMLEDLDHLLWSYKDTSFIAHLKIDEITEDNLGIPVILTTNEIEKKIHSDVVIKLKNTPLSYDWRLSDSFKVLEIVDQDQTVLESSRINYRDYKNRGFKISVHKL